MESLEFISGVNFFCLNISLLHHDSCIWKGQPHLYVASEKANPLLYAATAQANYFLIVSWVGNQETVKYVEKKCQWSWHSQDNHPQSVQRYFTLFSERGFIPLIFMGFFFISFTWGWDDGYKLTDLQSYQNQISQMIII